MECHKCPYNGKGDNRCLSCSLDETYHYPYQHYIIDTYDPPAPDTTASEQATELDDAIEDKLRKTLYDIFGLLPLELLVLQAIMNNKSLTDFSRELNNIIRRLNSNPEGMTRFHSFQLRKAVARKLPEFTSALLTKG